MKKRKISLESLKVKSFVTSLTGAGSLTIRGGSDITCHPTNCVNGGTVTDSATPGGGGNTTTNNNTTNNTTQNNTTGSGEDDTSGPNPHGTG